MILKCRDALYRSAQAVHLERWSRGIKNWHWVDIVTLNPEREKQVT
ncbi:hypothetical protein [Photorhabdus luminescens]|nr:hypothetical protein [Photorhabdus luminescens]